MDSPPEQSNTVYTPEMVLPHLHPMILIEKITGWGESWIETQANKADTRFFRFSDRGVSSTAALEYMCQSAAAHAGIRQLEANRHVTIGFIIGARRLQVDTAKFDNTNRFRIRVDQTFRDDEGIGVYHCRLFDLSADVEPIASTSIKAVMPENPELVIQKLGYQTHHE